MTIRLTGTLKKYRAASMALIFSGLILGADTVAAYEVFVGTQSGRDFGYEGGAAVYQYQGGTEWINISAGTDLEDQALAVMDLEFYNGALYAATQTSAGAEAGGGGGSGQIWRYDGDDWSLIDGDMGTSAMDLIIYRDELYVVTTDNYEKHGGKGNLYKFNGTDQWDLIATSNKTDGFFTAIVSDVSGRDEIIIGDLLNNKWFTYSYPDTEIVLQQDSGGFCIWDFAEYEGAVYSSSHWQGTIYKTDDGQSWKQLLHEAARDFWALETFQGNLYAGGSGGDYPNYTGRLDVILANSSLGKKWDYNTTSYPDGITQLAAAPDDSLLFIGTGIRAGFYAGDGQAEVWTYDGSDVIPISPADHFAGGVQSLLVTEGAGAIATEADAVGKIIINNRQANRDTAYLKMTNLVDIGTVVNNAATPYDLTFWFGGGGEPPAYTVSIPDNELFVIPNRLLYYNDHNAVTIWCRLKKDKCTIMLRRTEINEASLSENMTVSLDIDGMNYSNTGSWSEHDFFDWTIYKKLK